jgi:hypothetical protein
MLLLLRHVSANNSSHHEEYLRILEVKELGGTCDFSEDEQYC